MKVSAVLLALLAIGLAVPTMTGTFAFFSDSEPAEAHARAVWNYTPTCGLFWANSTTTAHTFKVTGSNHYFDGCIHTNMQMEIGGNDNTFNRTIEYVSLFTENGNNHVFRHPPKNVSPRNYPFPYDLSRYQPGGAVALAAAAQGKYFVHTANNLQLTGALLREGLHYSTGSVMVGSSPCTPQPSGPCKLPNITVVALNSVTFSQDTRSIGPFVDDLLFFGNGVSGNIVTLGGRENHVTGSLYAPRGHMHYSSSDSTYIGIIQADTLDVAGKRSTFIQRNPIISS